MNKYLRFCINAIVKLTIAFVGLLLSLNVLALGFIGFPELMTRTDEILLSNPSWLTYYLVPGTLPLFFILAMLALSIFVAYKTIRLIQIMDVEKILSAIKGKEDGK